MKRKAVIMGLVLMLLACAAGIASAEQVYMPQNGLTANDSEAYLLQDGAVWLLDDALKPDRMLDTQNEIVRNICAHGDALYLACAEANAVRFVAWAEDGMTPLFSVPGEADVQAFLAFDDRVIVMWENRREDYGHLPAGCARIGAYSLSGEKLDFPVAYAERMWTDGGNRVFLYAGFENVLTSVDVATGEYMEAELQLSDWNDIAGTPEALYYLGAEGLFLIRDGVMSSLHMDDYSSCTCQLAQVGDRIVVFDKWPEGSGDAIQYVYDPAPTIQQQKLTVVGYSDSALSVNQRMLRAAALWQADYPDMALEFVQLPMTQLNTILMAGGEGADLIYVDLYMNEPMIASGGLMDLSECPEIMDRLSEWIPGAPMVTYQGKVFGAPDELALTALTEQAALAQYEVPDFDVNDCSWQEFLQAAQRFQGDVNGDGRAELFFYVEQINRPMWLNQYISRYDALAEVEFDTPEFRELLSLYREAVRGEKIIDAFDDRRTGDNALYRAETYAEPAAYEWQTEPLIPQPRIGEAAVPIARQTAFAVNVRSPHREAALKLLGYFLSGDAAYGDDGGTFLRTDSAERMDMAAYTGAARERLESEMAYFTSLRPDLSTMEFRVISGELLDQYYAEQITEDELIGTLERELEMRRLG